MYIVQLIERSSLAASL